MRPADLASQVRSLERDATWKPSGSIKACDRERGRNLVRGSAGEGGYTAHGRHGEHGAVRVPASHLIVVDPLEERAGAAEGKRG